MLYKVFMLMKSRLENSSKVKKYATERLFLHDINYLIYFSFTSCLPCSHLSWERKKEWSLSIIAMLLHTYTDTGFIVHLRLTWVCYCNIFFPLK